MEKYPITTKTPVPASSVSNPKTGHFSMFYDSENGNLLSIKDSTGTVKPISSEIFDRLSSSALTTRSKLRFTNFLKATDDNVNGETVITVDDDELADFNSDDILDVGGVFKLALEEDKIYLGNSQGLAENKTLEEVFDAVTTLMSLTSFHVVDGAVELFLEEGKIYFGNSQDLAEQKTLEEVFDAVTEDMSTSIFHVVDGKIELLVEEGEIVLGDSLQRGRSSSIVDALGSLSNEVGDIFGIGIDDKVQLVGTPTHITRFNANGEAESQPLISGANKTIVTDENGDEQEVDLVSFLDLLTATSVTANGVLNTTDLGGTARGVLGSWKITNTIIKNTTSNVVVIDLGTTPGADDVLSGYSVPANGFVEVDLLKTLFSETVEQSIYTSSSNWNSANLIIKFSVKKVF